MAETAKKLRRSEEGREARSPMAGTELTPLARLRDQVDRIFDDFRRGTWSTPFDRTGNICAELGSSA